MENNKKSLWKLLESKAENQSNSNERRMLVERWNKVWNEKDAFRKMGVSFSLWHLHVYIST